MMPCGRLKRLSSTLLRTSYQRSGTRLAGVSSRKLTKMVVLPGRVKERTKSRLGTCWMVRSSRSVTCRMVSSSVAPGQAACTTIVLMVKAGSSLRPIRP